MSPFDTLKGDLIAPLIKNNPDASDNEIYRLAVRHFEANQSSRELCYEYFIKNALASIVRTKPQGDGSIAIMSRVSSPVPAPIRHEVEHRVTTPETRKAIVAEVKKVAPAAPAPIRQKVIEEVTKRFEHFTVRAAIGAQAATAIAEKPLDRKTTVTSLRTEAVAEAVAKAVEIEVPRAIEKVDRIEHMKVEATARVLLDFVLPDGTPVRKATFGAMAKFGGWAQAVSKLGPATALVGGMRGVSEEALQNIMKRFTEETKAAA